MHNDHSPSAVMYDDHGEVKHVVFLREELLRCRVDEAEWSHIQLLHKVDVNIYLFSVVTT